MGWNYDFGETEDRLRDACNVYPPDFAEIERLMAQCADISVVAEKDPDESILSDIILWYPDVAVIKQLDQDEPLNGRYLPQIVKLFLDHGFDVHRGEGRVGAKCLSNLMHSSKDVYMLEAEKLLLDAGADPTIRIDEYDAIEAYWGEESFLFSEGDDRLASLYHTMAKIAEAASEKKDYRGIEIVLSCIGKRIDRIELACAETIPKKTVYNVGFPVPKYKNCFLSPIVFHCEGKALCVDRHASIWVDPNVPQEAKRMLSIEKHFPDCVGHRITDVEFRRREVWHDLVCYGQPIVLIRLDNGKTIRFSINFGEVPREETAAFFAVI